MEVEKKIVIFLDCRLILYIYLQRFLSSEFFTKLQNELQKIRKASFVVIDKSNNLRIIKSKSINIGKA